MPVTVTYAEEVTVTGEMSERDALVTVTAKPLLAKPGVVTHLRVCGDVQLGAIVLDAEVPFSTNP